MELILPARAHAALINEIDTILEICLRDHFETPSPIDRILLRRFAEALDSARPMIVACPDDEYDGGVPERHSAAAPQTDAWCFASDILDDALRRRPDAIWLAWLRAGLDAPLTQNDACEREFTIIVKADPRDVRWFVASSIHTWIASGVFTPPILRESLERMIASSPSLVHVLRGHAADPDRYTKFMLEYACQVLDGQFRIWQRSGFDEFLARYSAAIARGVMDERVPT